MNETVYKAGSAVVEFLTSAEVIAKPLDAFSRVWMRHRKLRSHLRALQFDGVIDGGANVGEFAEIVRSALPVADLVCVEPHPASAQPGDASTWRRYRSLGLPSSARNCDLRGPTRHS